MLFVTEIKKMPVFHCVYPVTDNGYCLVDPELLLISPDDAMVLQSSWSMTDTLQECTRSHQGKRQDTTLNSPKEMI